MKLNELMEIVSAAYPDGLIATEYWDFKRECPRRNLKGGDTLALFIALELKDTYDADASDDKQLSEAMRVVDRAARDLNTVYDALREERDGNPETRCVCGHRRNQHRFGTPCGCGAETSDGHCDCPEFEPA